KSRNGLHCACEFCTHAHETPGTVHHYWAENRHFQKVSCQRLTLFGEKLPICHICPTKSSEPGSQLARPPAKSFGDLGGLDGEIEVTPPRSRRSARDSSATPFGTMGEVSICSPELISHLSV